MSLPPAGQKWSCTLSELSCKPWKTVGSVCKDAAVFLDNGAAELLHWAGGMKLCPGCVGLYDLHAKLDPVARDFIAAAPYCHVVIVTSTFLHGVVSERISVLLSDLQPLECHVFCSQPEEMHAELLPVVEGGGLDYSLEGYSHYGEFQALMRKWIDRDAGVRVSVQHLPLFHAEVCSGLVTTPPYSTLFPLMPSDTVEIQARLLSEGATECNVEDLNQVDFDMLSRHFQTELKGFASGLNSMLTEWGMAEELFSLGQTSRFIASQLATMPAARVRRKTAAYHCSLVLIDRTLDVATPTFHPADSLADRILSLLPHATPLSSDVTVSMGPLTSDGGEWALNGSLAQPGHAKAKQLLRTLICSKQKECLMEMSRALLDCLSQEGLSVKLSGKLARPSALQLKTFIQQFKDRPQACVSQHPVLQLACAVVQALEGDVGKHWDRLASIEKVLLLSVQDGEGPSVALQLAQEVRKQRTLCEGREEGGAATAQPLSTTLAQLVGVAVAMFSLVGMERCCKGGVAEEVELKEAFAALACKWRPCDVQFLETSLGLAQSDSNAAILGRFDTLMERIEGLGTARDHLTQFRHTFLPLDSSPLPHQPLLSQVTRAVFDSGRPELPDLYCHFQAATVTNLLKSGFSLFVTSSKPRPHQHPVLLLFVVGGVTCWEARQIREAVAASKTDINVIVGATRLVTSHDITAQVLSQHSHT